MNFPGCGQDCWERTTGPVARFASRLQYYMHTVFGSQTYGLMSKHFPLLMANKKTPTTKN